MLNSKSAPSNDGAGFFYWVNPIHFQSAQGVNPQLSPLPVSIPMPNKEPVEFTDRENFLVSFYRSPELSNAPGVWVFDLAFMLASLTAAALFIRDRDMAWAFAAYFLLFGRLCYVVMEGRRWSKDFHNIVKKYDAMLSATSEKSFQSDSESK